jgi:hypothetical protein
MSRPMKDATAGLWRVAGTLALAHVVLVFGGFSLQRTPLLGDSRANVMATLVKGSMTTVFAGGYVEYLGFLVYLVWAVLIAQLLRGDGDTARWLSSCISAAAVAFTAITVASGFAAGAAAMYDGHHGASLDVITTVNDVRNFAFFLTIGLQGVLTLAVAGAVHLTVTLPRWVAYAGYVIGVLSVVGIAGAGVGALDYIGMAWFVWFLALAVVCLRVPRRAERPTRDAVVARA